MICPYCLRKMKKTDLKMVCNICGKPQEKPKMGMNPFKNLGVIRKKIAGGNACQTSGCLGNYVNVKCGMCGEELPPDIAQYSRFYYNYAAGIETECTNIKIQFKCNE